MAMKYAIVSFEDMSFSEVPISWICNNNQNCWWPNTKNVTSFIIKETEPVENKWAKHKIVIHEYCDSWEKARKRAEDISCTESEDAGKTEGKTERVKRKVSLKRNKIYEDGSSDADDSSDSSDLCLKKKRTLPIAPKFPFNIDTVHTAHQENYTDKIDDVMPVASVPDQIFDTETLAISSTPKSKESTVSSLQRLSQLERISSNIVNPAPLNHNILYSMNTDPNAISPIPKSRESSLRSLQRLSQLEGSTIVNPSPRNHILCSMNTDPNAIPSTSKSKESSVCSIQSLSQLEGNSSTLNSAPRNNLFYSTNTDPNVKNYFKIIMDTLVEIKMDLNTIKNKTGGPKTDTTKFEAFTKYFPIKNLETFNIVNAILLEGPIKNDFVSYLKSFGGNNLKDYLYRILRQIFSNAFATNCSWLGLRNNIKLDGTVIMNILRDFSVTVLESQHKQFETCTSEWFRHAQQRLKREKQNE